MTDFSEVMKQFLFISIKTTAGLADAAVFPHHHINTSPNHHIKQFLRAKYREYEQFLRICCH